MFQSRLMQECIAESLHEAIQEFLKARFGAIPRDITRLLREILDLGKLKQLSGIAAKCTDLQEFRDALLS